MAGPPCELKLRSPANEVVRFPWKQQAVIAAQRRQCLDVVRTSVLEHERSLGRVVGRQPGLCVAESILLPQEAAIAEVETNPTARPKATAYFFMTSLPIRLVTYIAEHGKEMAMSGASCQEHQQNSKRARSFLRALT